MAFLPNKEECETHTELTTLSWRSKFINVAITLGTLCALLICSMIAVMFVGVFLSIDLTDVVALLFVTGVCAFIGGLLAFLREIFIAVKALRIGMKQNSEEEGGVSCWSGA